jgi:hypothetical protein
VVGKGWFGGFQIESAAGFFPCLSQLGHNLQPDGIAQSIEEVERHPVAESLLRRTDEAYSTLLKAGDFGQAVVQMVGPLLLSSDPVCEKMRNTLEEIEINYRQGPITEDHGGSDGPRAGDRLLDGTVVKLPSKQTLLLREIIRGTRRTLLLFSGHGHRMEELQTLLEIGTQAMAYFPEALQAFVVVDGFPVPSMADSSIPILLDAMSHLHDQFGVKDACLYLVRPDWYIGFRGGIKHAGELPTYLARVLTSVQEPNHGV